MTQIDIEQIASSMARDARGGNECKLIGSIRAITKFVRGQKVTGFPYLSISRMASAILRRGNFYLTRGLRPFGRQALATTGYGLRTPLNLSIERTLLKKENLNG